MGDEIAQLAGQIAAAEARFLRLLGSFDLWEGWGGPGVRSLAHWLSWRAGMSLRTARLVLRALGGQRFEFVDGVRGTVLAPAPPMDGRADEIVADRTIGPRTVTGGWSGEPLDLSLVTSGLLDYWRAQRTSDPLPGRAGGWGPTVYDHAVAWDDPSLGPWEPVSAA